MLPFSLLIVLNFCWSLYKFKRVPDKPTRRMSPHLISLLKVDFIKAIIKSKAFFPSSLLRNSCIFLSSFAFCCTLLEHRCLHSAKVLLHAYTLCFLPPPVDISPHLKLEANKMYNRFLWVTANFWKTGCPSVAFKSLNLCSAFLL